MEGKKRFASSTLWRLLLFILVLLLIAGGTSLFWGQRADESDSAIERFENLLKQNRIKEARGLYYEELFGDVVLQGEAEEAALEALQAVKVDFAAGRFGYEQALNAVRAFEQSGIFLPSMYIDSVYNQIAGINLANLNVEAGATAFAEGEYLLAAEYYDEVPVGHRLYATAQDGKRRSLNQYRADVIAEAETLLAEGHYIACVQVLEAALEVMPQDADLVDAYGEALVLSDDRYRQHIIDLARAQSDKGDVVFALQILEAAVNYLQEVNLSGESLPDDHSLKQANLSQDIRLLRAEASRIRADVIQTSMAEIDDDIAKAEFQAALATLDEAMVFMPDSTILANKETELASLITYTLNDFMAAKAELLELNAGLALMSEWQANFGEGIVELYPAADLFPSGQFDLWDIAAGVNHFEANFVLEYNENMLAALGISQAAVGLEVRIVSGENEEVFSLNADEPTRDFAMTIDRASGFLMEATLVIQDTTVADTFSVGALDDAGLMRLFVTAGQFTNDGSLSLTEDYRAQQADLADRAEAAASASWRELHSMSYLDAQPNTGTDPNAEVEEPGQSVEAGNEGNVTEPSEPDADEDLNLLVPYRADKGRDTAANNYRNVYLYTEDSRPVNRWSSQRGFRRVRGTVAWQDPANLNQMRESELFLNPDQVDRDQINTDSTVTLIIYADDKAIGRFTLTAGSPPQSFYIDLPFESKEIRLSLVDENGSERDGSFVCLLDLEVSP